MMNHKKAMSDMDIKEFAFNKRRSPNKNADIKNDLIKEAGQADSTIPNIDV